MAQPGSVPTSQGDSRNWGLSGNVVWFRGQLRETGQIKFSLKFQAGHSSPGEGCVPDSTARPGEAVQGMWVGALTTETSGGAAAPVQVATLHALLCAGGSERE